MADKNTLNDDVIDDEEDFIDIDDIEELQEVEAQAPIFRRRIRGYRDISPIHLDEEEEEKKEQQKPSYELIYNHGLAEGEEPLSRVVGHTNQKKELLNVIDWFKRSKELKQRGVSIPKGCILFGEPGNGKSLLIKEIIRCINAPVFVLKGDETNIVAGITETFAKAREVGHAVVVIDELDLLINKERRVIRALQENLDGVESCDDILVLSATNCIGDIPDALLRNGRLEKLIRIPYPTGEEALTLLKIHLKEFKVALPEDFDEEEVALSLNGISCAGVKAVVNDLVLRNGFENITSDMVFDSIYNVTDRIKDPVEKDNIEISYHEAGHAVMAHAYPEYFLINRISIKGASGAFHAKEVDIDFWPFAKVIADIKVSMAGLIAQKVICGRGTRGSDTDLQRARVFAYNLVNMCGYSSCWETLPTIKPGSRVETATKRRRMEKKIEKLLKRCEKETTAYVKKHAQQIKDLGNLLFEKKHLKSSEILSVIG